MTITDSNTVTISAYPLHSKLQGIPIFNLQLLGGVRGRQKAFPRNPFPSVYVYTKINIAVPKKEDMTITFRG